MHGDRRVRDGARMAVCAIVTVCGSQVWRGLRTECSAAAPRNDCGARGPWRPVHHPHDGPASGRAPSRRLASQQFCATSPLLSSQLSVGSWRNERPPMGNRAHPMRPAWPPGRPAALGSAPRGSWACGRGGVWVWSGVASARGVSSAPAACVLGRHPTCPGVRAPPRSIAARGWSRNRAPTCDA